MRNKNADGDIERKICEMEGHTKGGGRKGENAERKKGERNHDRYIRRL